MTTLGPAHLVAIGLENENMRGQVARELHRASESGAIRVFEAHAVQRSTAADSNTLGETGLTRDERIAYGAIIGGLIGFGATGTDEGAEAGAELGAVAFAERSFGLSGADFRSIAESLAPGTTAVMVLFEHRWAIPL